MFFPPLIIIRALALQNHSKFISCTVSFSCSLIQNVQLDQQIFRLIDSESNRIKIITKTKLPDYVAKGMAAIKTDEMQLTIQVCFAVGTFQ